MVVHRVRSRHLVRAQRHLDRKVLVDKLRRGFRTLCVRQFGLDDQGRKVRRGVADDGGR